MLQGQVSKFSSAIMCYTPTRIQFTAMWYASKSSDFMALYKSVFNI